MVAGTDMFTNATVLVFVIALASVTAQTFQYSRGWTNGKRDGHRRAEDEPITLKRIFSPCQMHKLKYLLDGKPVNEKLLTPCDFLEEDGEEPRRHKMKTAQDSIYDLY